MHSCIALKGQGDMSFHGWEIGSIVKLGKKIKNRFYCSAEQISSHPDG